MKKSSRHKTRPKRHRHGAAPPQALARTGRTKHAARSVTPRKVAEPRRAPVARAAAYSSDDREVIALLVLPFLLLTLAIGASQSLRRERLDDLLARAPAITAPSGEMASPSLTVAREADGAAAPAADATLPVPDAPPSSAPEAAKEAASPDPAAAPPPAGSVASLAPAAPESTSTPSHEARQGAGAAEVAPPVPPVAEEKSAPPAPLAPQGQLVAEPAVSPPSDEASLSETRLALAAPVPPPEARAPVTSAPDVPSSEASASPPAALPPGVAASAETEVAQCTAKGALASRPAVKMASFVPDETPGDFGLRLAAAARGQLDEFVIYNDKYATLAYPRGDVAAIYGVCTDVVIRAYRNVGLDLQELVHLSRLGSGDTNIDHRRVDTLRKFFATYGESLPVSQFGEDYHPGDIVSYYRPQNAHSRTHIAVVSDVLGPSGRPMIIHNRGWGPQMEDALFVDEMTGHYRYAGARRPGVKAPVAAQSKPAAPVKKSSLRKGPKSVQTEARQQLGIGPGGPSGATPN